MKLKIISLTLLILCAVTTTSTFAGTTALQQTATSLLSDENSKLKLDFVFSNKNAWRGVTLSKSPSVSIKMQYDPCKFFYVGTKYSTDGYGGYGNNMKNYVGITVKNFHVFANDYYYFTNNENDYFDYSSKNTMHNVESGLKYDNKTVYLMAAYTVLSNSAQFDSKGAYLQAGYKVSDIFSVFAGYVTDANSTVFATKGGFNNVGFTASKVINVTDKFSPLLDATIMINPNYKNTTRLVDANNQINCIATISF